MAYNLRISKQKHFKLVCDFFDQQHCEVERERERTFKVEGLGECTLSLSNITKWFLRIFPSKEIFKLGPKVF